MRQREQRLGEEDVLRLDEVQLSALVRIITTQLDAASSDAASAADPAAAEPAAATIPARFHASIFRPPKFRFVQRGKKELNSRLGGKSPALRL